MDKNNIQEIYIKNLGTSLNNFPLFIMLYPIYFLSVLSLVLNVYEKQISWVVLPIFILVLITFEYSLRNLYLKRRPDKIILSEDCMILSYFFNMIQLKYLNQDYSLLESDDKYFMRLKIKGWRLPFGIKKNVYYIPEKESWRIWLK